MAAGQVAGRRLPPLSGDIIGRGKSGAANIRTDLTGARENIVDAAQAGFPRCRPGPRAHPRNLRRSRPRRQQCRHLRAAARDDPALRQKPRRDRRADRARRRGRRRRRRHGDSGHRHRLYGETQRRHARRSAAGVFRSATRPAAAASAATFWRKRCLRMTASDRPRRSPTRSSPCSATAPRTWSNSPSPPSRAITAASRRKCSTMPRRAIRSPRRSLRARSRRSRPRSARSTSTARRRSACSAGWRRSMRRAFRRATRRC